MRRNMTPLFLGKEPAHNPQGVQYNTRSADGNAGLFLLLVSHFHSPPAKFCEENLWGAREIQEDGYLLLYFNFT